MSHALIEELSAVLPRGRLATDPDIIASFSQDQAAWAPVEPAAAVVKARSTDEVRAVVAACLRHGVAVVPRGAGTGLSGGANATKGCVILCLEAMNKVVEVNPLERYAVVQPGVVNDAFRAAMAEHDLWYPPDPASSPWSTIGGNVATNAGGICCVKYGVTKDYVLELEVVTGTAEVVRLGQRTAKGVAGFDLAALMVGSEGTLGIITEVTLRLRDLPPPAITIAGFFDSITAAGEGVRAVAAAGITPSALELVDRTCLEAVDDWKRMDLTVAGNALVLARIDDPEPTGSTLAGHVVDAFTGAGATWAERSSDAAEGDALFAARRLAYPALERLGPVLTEDVCVPRSVVPQMLGRVEAIATANRIQIANIAHAGDGNLHPLIICPPEDPTAQERAEAAFEQILDAALALGGTVTGEHGVGILKMGGLTRELSPAVLAMHRAVKSALDPAGILNPGKVI